MKYPILLLLCIHFTMFQNSNGQTTIPLYKGEIPNSKPSADKEKTEITDIPVAGGIIRSITIISAITRPTLTVFLPSKDKANGTAVIICPGGGYSVNAFSHEGLDVAKAFNEFGVAAFVLKYRIPNDATMENREIGPWQDAQQAIKIVRQRASEWNVNPNRIGIMGFSAGGHLASTAGTHFNKVVIPDAGNTSLRPDFMILVYPVISFKDSFGHIGSRDNLIGKNPPEEKINYYSNELQITPQTPPTFLVHASDDEAVKSENSIAFYQDLIRNKVPAEVHIYEKGGHGFGLNNKTTSDRWMERCKNWMAGNGWLTK